jgi:hypothetical protein
MNSGQSNDFERATAFTRVRAQLGALKRKRPREAAVLDSAGRHGVPQRVGLHSAASFDVLNEAQWVDPFRHVFRPVFNLLDLVAVRPCPLGEALVAGNPSVSRLAGQGADATLFDVVLAEQHHIVARLSAGVVEVNHVARANDGLHYVIVDADCSHFSNPPPK